MSLAESPAAEDQVVIANLSERLIERVASRRGEDDVVERSFGDDSLDRAPAGQAA